MPHASHESSRNVCSAHEWGGEGQSDIKAHTQMEKQNLRLLVSFHTGSENKLFSYEAVDSMKWHTQFIVSGENFFFWHFPKACRVRAWESGQYNDIQYKEQQKKKKKDFTK